MRPVMGLGHPRRAFVADRVLEAPARLRGLGALVGTIHGVGPRMGAYVLEGDTVPVVLVGQADQAENGPWIAQSGVWERPILDSALGFEEDRRASEIVAGIYPLPRTKEGALGVMGPFLARLVWDAEVAAAHLARCLVDGGDYRRARDLAATTLWRVDKAVEAFRGLRSERYEELPADWWARFGESAAIRWWTSRGSRSGHFAPGCHRCGTYMEPSSNGPYWACPELRCSLYCLPQ